MARIPLAIGEVAIGAKHFAISLIRPGQPGPVFRLRFEDHSGWIVAGIDDPGWLVDLDPTARAAFSASLAALYKLAGVDLVRESIETALGPEAPAYGLRREGLVVWPGESSSAEVLYLLRPSTDFPPLVTIDGRNQPAIVAPPILDPAQILFAKTEISWTRWVAFWDRDRLGELEAGPGDGLVSILPVELKSSSVPTPDSDLEPV